MNVNQAAFATITTLCCTAIAGSVKAATAITTISTVAYTAIALVAIAFAIAAVSSYFAIKGEIEQIEDTASSYFTKMISHGPYAVVTALGVAAETIVIGVVRGIANGVGNAISEKISGQPGTV